ncbi:MAG: hypothetical protein V3V96_15335 [Acidiferrobacterales bacterium]
MAHNLPSLERKREKAEQPTLVNADEGPFFPLSLYVHDDEIAAMGLETAQLGEERMLLAKVRVTSISAHETEGKKKRGNVDISLLEGTTTALPKEKDRADILFDKM